MRTMTLNFREGACDQTSGLDAVASARRLWATIETWRARARQRRSLARLSPVFLRDIGIDQVDVWREVNKPWWRA